MEELIVLISRYPRAGESKTRLIPELGAEKAAQMQKKMTEFALYEAFSSAYKIHVHFSNGTKEQMKTWLLESLYKKCFLKNNLNAENKEDFFEIAEKRIEFIEQVEGDLGEKLSATLYYAQDYFKQINATKQKILIMGADCPDFRSEAMKNAFMLLDKHACVFGPTFDKGYYAIAFSLEKENIEKYIDVFTDISWSTEEVYAQSIAKIRKNALSYTLLEKLSDVDYVVDIPKKISVIIPTLNEENNIKKLFLHIPNAFNVEFIVSDASSCDKTVEIAKKYADIVIDSEKGRAIQFQNAFEKSSGEIILFMHADTLLSKSWDREIRKSLENENVKLVYFKFAIIKTINQSILEKIKIFLLEVFTNFRADYLKLPYGDQGLAFRYSDYKDWNLPIYPILEDVYLVRKARSCGIIKSIEQKAYTSFRRWEKHGFLKVTFINHSVMLCNSLNMDLNKIKACYWQGKNPLFLYIKEKFSKLF